MTALRFTDVGFRYGDGPQVLHGVGLGIAAGATAVVGANGAGKSTLLRLCNGLLRPSSGRVLVGDVDTREAAVAQLARTVGLVFQDPADQLFRPRLVDDVAFGPSNLGLADPEARAAAALARVGLGDAGDAHPYELGLADRKLATIAGVLAMDVAVLALDEPTMGQDAAGVDRLVTLVTELADERRTLLVVSHDMSFVARSCSRVVVLSTGRVAADGPPRDVFAEEDVLTEAGLAPPPVTALGRRLGLPATVVTLDELVTGMRGGR